MKKVLDKLGTTIQLLHDIQSGKLKYLGHINRKKKQYTDNYNRGQARRQETKRASTRQLVWKHQRMDQSYSTWMHKTGFQSSPVECHITPTVEQRRRHSQVIQVILYDKIVKQHVIVLFFMYSSFFIFFQNRFALLSLFSSIKSCNHDHEIWSLRLINSWYFTLLKR